MITNLTGADVALSIASRGHRNSEFVGGWENAVEKISGDLKKGDLLMTLGAGDIWKAGELLLERLEEKG